MGPWPARRVGYDGHRRWPQIGVHDPRVTLLRACRVRGRSAGDLLADGRGYLGAEQLDGSHRLLVGQRADADLGHKSIVAEVLVLVEDLLGDLLGAADGERPARRAS